MKKLVTYYLIIIVFLILLLSQASCVSYKGYNSRCPTYAVKDLKTNQIKNVCWEPIYTIGDKVDDMETNAKYIVVTDYILKVSI